MKKIITLCISLGVALGCLVGCKSINSLTPGQVAQIGTVITQTANFGAVYAIQQDERNAAYFKAAVPILDNFANGTVLTPSALQIALANTSLATNQWVSLAISAVVVAYDVSYSKYISDSLTNIPVAKSWIIAIETGFQQALAQTDNTRLRLEKEPNPPYFIKEGKLDKAAIRKKIKSAKKDVSF
jgi:hypothetical protein